MILRRHRHRGVREGTPVSAVHQPQRMLGVDMRQQHRIDLLGPVAGGGERLAHPPGAGEERMLAAGIDQHQVAAGVHQIDADRLMQDPST
jgi:hypothetical protein